MNKIILQEILDTFSEELDNNNFTPIYEFLNSSLNPKDVGEFTQILLDNDIDPLVRMKSITSYMFFNCNLGEEYIIPDNIEEINYGAFLNCKVKSIKVGDNVSSIRHNAFANNRFIEKIYFGQNIREFATNCIAGCIALKEITCPKYMEEFVREGIERFLNKEKDNLILKVY